jgi:6-phosphogluconolactonase
MTVEIIEYDDKDTQMLGLATRVAKQLREALAEKGNASLVVPGGTTPSPFLRELSTKQLDWENVTVFLSDERFVPTTSDRSNTALVRDALIQNEAAKAKFFEFWRDGLEPDELAEHLGAELADFGPFDVCVVGMGLDMHTASLFPSMDRLNEALIDTQNKRILAVYPEGQPEARLTLTAPFLRASRKMHLLITGSDKRTALKRAVQTENPALAPIKALMTVHRPILVHFSL